GYVRCLTFGIIASGGDLSSASAEQANAPASASAEQANAPASALTEQANVNVGRSDQGRCFLWSVQFARTGKAPHSKWRSRRTGYASPRHPDCPGVPAE